MLYEKKKEYNNWKSRNKRNLQKNNKEEYAYNTNHHINKIKKKHWSNYHSNKNQIYYYHYSELFIIRTLSYHTVLWWKNILLHTHIHTYENMDIVLLTLFFASIEAPASASIRTLVTSAWPLQAAHMRGVHPFWWNYVNEGKYNTRYDYQ